MDFIKMWYKFQVIRIHHTFLIHKKSIFLHIYRRFQYCGYVTSGGGMTNEW